MKLAPWYERFAELRKQGRAFRQGSRRSAENLVVETWRAATDAFRYRPSEELEGCGDGACVVAPPRGMHTNSHCRCDEHRLRAAVLALRAELERRSVMLPEEEAAWRLVGAPYEET